jgi:hypothetical protein
MAVNWGLDWQGFLPGKRESRRYIGDHVLCQDDVESGGKFEDIVAYGGWSMDDHFPAGFYHPEKGTTFYPAPSPYGIPHRSLYSKNIQNLYCGGRCISSSHVALSSTRVMATCSVIGQAIGTAASIAVKQATTPRGVYQKYLTDLQEMLMADDCWLPGKSRKISELTKTAAIKTTTGEPDILRNGFDRPVGEISNRWQGEIGEAVELTWDQVTQLDHIYLIFDSNLNREEKSKQLDAGEFDRRVKNMRHYYTLDIADWTVPESLVKTFDIEIKDETGNWNHLLKKENNYQRNVKITLNVKTTGLRLIPLETWGDNQVNIFSLYVV